MCTYEAEDCHTMNYAEEVGAITTLLMLFHCEGARRRSVRE